MTPIDGCAPGPQYISYCCCCGAMKADITLEADRAIQMMAANREDEEFLTMLVYRRNSRLAR